MAIADRRATSYVCPRTRHGERKLDGNAVRVPTSAVKPLLWTTIWAAGCFGLWLALTDNIRPLELAVGAGAAVVSGALAAAAMHAGDVRFAPRAVWLRRALAAPFWIARDTGIVFGALAAHLLGRRGLEGRIVPVRMRAGGDDGRSAARRALSGWLGSMGPNSYPVGFEDDVLVVHQLVPTDDLTPADLVREL